MQITILFQFYFYIATSVFVKNRSCRKKVTACRKLASQSYGPRRKYFDCGEVPGFRHPRGRCGHARKNRIKQQVACQTILTQNGCRKQPLANNQIPIISRISPIKQRIDGSVPGYAPAPTFQTKTIRNPMPTPTPYTRATRYWNPKLPSQELISEFNSYISIHTSPECGSREGVKMIYFASSHLKNAEYQNWCKCKDAHCKLIEKRTACLRSSCYDRRKHLDSCDFRTFKTTYQGKWVKYSASLPCLI